MKKKKENKKVDTLNEENQVETAQNQEEQVAKEATTNIDEVYNLVKGKEDDEFLATSEEERKMVLKMYNKTRTRNNIIMVAVVAAFIGAFILIALGTWGQIAGWVIVGTSITAMVIYYAISNKKYPQISKNYCYNFWRRSNDFLFNQEGFSDCYLDMTEKYDMSSVIADRVYENVIDIASRNIVHGKYNGQEFKFGELAFYRQGAKKRQKDVVFVGRHLEISNNLKIDGRILINLRGEKEFDLPTDISDLATLKDGQYMLIYGKEGLDYEKVLGKELLKELEEYAIKDPLLNINIVFWHKRTAVYLSYDDSIVAIPYSSELKKEAYVAFKQNIKDLFAILMK